MNTGSGKSFAELEEAVYSVSVHSNEEDVTLLVNNSILKLIIGRHTQKVCIFVIILISNIHIIQQRTSVHAAFLDSSDNSHPGTN